jgi:hypothetical protein
MKLLLVIGILGLTACATEAPKSVVQVKREAVLACVKDLKASDSTTMDAFEVCRQVYNLNNIGNIQNTVITTKNN